MKATDLGSASFTVGTTGRTTIECLCLDKILPVNGSFYIKFDIEGYEREALTGTKAIIQASSPNLPVCLYHRPDDLDDLWDIPLLINNISNGYQFYLRSYMGWESVCYALKSRR